MDSIRKISDPIYHENDREKMEKMNEVYYKIADYVKDTSPDKYRQYMEMAEDIAYTMDVPKAKAYVKAMMPYGQHWNYEDVKKYVMEKGIAEEQAWEYYMVMNSMYNDYKRTAEKHGTDSAEFYYDLAYDYINDVDGKKHKIARYFMS